MEGLGSSDGEKLPLGDDRVLAAPIPSGAPPQYQPNPEDVRIVLSLKFLKSVEGILKVVQMVFGLITFICATVGRDRCYGSACGGLIWVQVASMITLILTAALFVMHAFKITEKIPEKIPFKLIEYFYCFLVTLFYATCGTVCAAIVYSNGAIIAAAVFAFFSMAVYLSDSVLRVVRPKGGSSNLFLTRSTSSPAFHGSSASALAVAETLY